MANFREIKFYVLNYVSFALNQYLSCEAGCTVVIEFKSTVKY